MDLRTERQKKIQQKQENICKLYKTTKGHLDYPVPAVTIFRMIAEKTGASIPEIRRILIKFGLYGTNKQTAV